ncbi:unnamed protein product [Phytophthora lilii]|uniref:Unnamed protein product n=1 Tax=Phytophthora lilii TaxID=2077276 RepID=A0A9W7CQU3_9STRA|nr:unnamed protein product [Phytophthora lilii]
MVTYNSPEQLKARLLLLSSTAAHRSMQCARDAVAGGRKSDNDWASKTVRPRPTVRAATSVGGRRCGQPRMSPKQRTAATLCACSVHGYHSEVGTTRLARPRDLKKLLKAADNEFCFLVNAPNTPAETAKAAAAWDALKGNPMYPLLLEFRDIVFRSELPSVPPTRQGNMNASIDVSDAIPVHRKQFPFSKEQRKAILKIVHDFRGLNAKVRVPANPIPRKDEILRAMAQGRLFSALDLLWGFFQVKLREDSIPYTAFLTPDGLYEYLVTPMGISSSPSCFNRLVQSIYKDYHSFCRTYFDDLFIFTSSDSVEEHAVALRKVLTRCAEQQLYVKIKKMCVCAREIPCLGDIVGVDGVRIDSAKAAAIRDWPVPKTKRKLQSFIGTCVYASRFCASFADHIALLTEVVKSKLPIYLISFTKQQKAVFESLKVKLSSTPILAHADFTKDFYVSVDASDFAVGGYIFQYDDEGRERVIAYGGRKLTQAELIPNPKLLRQLTAQEADPDAVTLFAPQSSNLAKLHETCRSSYSNDAVFGPIMRDLASEVDRGSRRLRRFTVDDGVLYFQVRPDTPRRLCIPDVVGLRNSIMFEEHDPPTRGHAGQAKTLLTLLGKYYLRGMSESVQRYVASCELCQRNKYVRGKPAGMLHPLEIPAQRWTDISMDFKTQLPLTTSGHDAVMVIVDRLTKRGHSGRMPLQRTPLAYFARHTNDFMGYHALSYQTETQSLPRSFGGIMKLQGTTLQ